MLNFFQSSRNKATTIHLYEVTYGITSASKMYLTDAEEDLLVAGNTYQSVQIKHDEISASGSLDKTSFEVRTPENGPLVGLFRYYPPNKETALVIYQGDLNDPDGQFLPIWFGRILNFAIENIEAKFACEPRGTATRRPGLRRNMQVGCPHVLYGPSCRANKLARTVNTNVQLISGSIVRLTDNWFAPFTPANFRAGVIEWRDGNGDTVTRTVLQLINGAGVASDLLLSGPPISLMVGQAVSVSCGCTHQMSDCRDLHQNINNYGGQPWIPLKNPIGNYNNFY